MDFLSYLKKFKAKGIEFQNILIYNVDIYVLDLLKESSLYGKNITFAFDNNFTISSYSAKMRFYKNISFINSSLLLNSNFLKLNYDLVIMGKNSSDLIKYVIKNEFIQFIVTECKKIPPTLFEKYEDNIYKRNFKKILLNVEDEFNDFQKQKVDIIKTNRELDKLLLNKYYDIKSDVNETNDLDNEYIIQETGINQEIKQEIKQEINNNDLIDQKFFVVNVTNLCPREIKYSNSNYNEKNHDGIIALSMIIQDENDFIKFNTCKIKILSQYDNIKYYIILNGKDSFQFLKNFSDSAFLLSSESILDETYCKRIFHDVIKNEYYFNINTINFNQLENIWDL